MAVHHLKKFFEENKTSLYLEKSLTCAMKIAAIASYNAFPSMLMLAPMGSTNLATRASTLFFLSRHSMVMGRVAEEEAVQKAVVRALAMLPMNVKGSRRVTSTGGRETVFFFIVRKKKRKD